MAGLYFPNEKNLTAFTRDQMKAVHDAVNLLKAAKLPNDWCYDLDGLEFYSDTGMTLDNGVLGYTTFLKPKRILIASYLADGLTWTASGVPNNEMAMSIVTHELTHTAQRRWMGGLVWLILNIPGIDRLTLEKWAVENEQDARDYLQHTYGEMRR